MNSKEIKEALEIIKKPITVNCIEYKYFDDENYNKLIEVYDNCLWFANNLEQINLTVENLQKENKQLKEKLDCDLKWAFKCDELTKENQKLKKHQKEFIKYLESKINKIRLNSNTTTLHAYSKKIIPYIEILSKYKEIIKSDK